MSSHPDDGAIDSMTALLGIPVEPEWKPAVRMHLEATLTLARLFDTFPLPDDAEPAPVFEA